MTPEAFWGDGYVPRVSKRSRGGVELAFVPDLINGSRPAPAWAIVDAPTAEQAENLVPHLRESGIRVLVDTQAWRYADSRTWDSSTWGTTTYRPMSPFQATRAWVSDYVRQDLSAQARLGADAVLLPNWFQALTCTPIDVAEWVLEGYHEFRRRRSLLRAIGWLPVRLREAEVVSQLAQTFVDSGEVQGIIAQLERVSVLRAPVDQVVGAVDVMLDAQARGLPVLAGRFGNIGVTVRATGIAAAECGPVDDQTFNAAEMVRSSLPRPANKQRTRNPLACRIWLSELGQTVTSNQMADLRESRRAYAEIFCRRPCHQFRRGRDGVQTAAWHSTLARMEEASYAAMLPQSMRIDAARRHLATVAQKVDLINLSLSNEGKSWQLAREHVNTQQAVLAHVSHRHGAA